MEEAIHHSPWSKTKGETFWNPFRGLSTNETSFTFEADCKCPPLPGALRQELNTVRVL
jgi:hypothetical protein